MNRARTRTRAERNASRAQMESRRDPEKCAMATRWYYEAFGLELGPVSFRELVELVRSGRLTEDDLVRANYMPGWERAVEVVGLFHMAHRHSDLLVEPSVPVVDPELNAMPIDLSIAVTTASSDEQRAELPTGSAPPARLPTDNSLAEAVATALPYVDERFERRRAKPGAISRWHRRLRQTSFFRSLRWRAVPRLGAGIGAALLAATWVKDWSAREALRFPGLLDDNVRMFPFVGECHVAEYWVFVADLIFLAAVGAYVFVRWIEYNLE